MAFPLGNLAALRTFRVLRALKTVAVVPGTKRRVHVVSTVMWPDLGIDGEGLRLCDTY